MRGVEGKIPWSYIPKVITVAEFVPGTFHADIVRGVEIARPVKERNAALRNIVQLGL